MIRNTRYYIATGKTSNSNGAKMIFRITDKLAKKIKESPQKSLPPAESPYLDWTANLFCFNRVQYVIVSNTQSLYSIIMYAKGINDYSIFINYVLSDMGNFMVEDGNEFIFSRLIAPNAKVICFSKPEGKRVIGSMNNLIYLAESHLEENFSPHETACRINKAPMGLLKYVQPCEAFKTMLPFKLV
ncbi:MAG: hypothetical protein WC637_19415 [Victivallales bacterium]|jgi:hypothetical protein